MILSDIKEYLLVNSLQYFIGEEDIEVTDTVLTQLSNRALAFHSNWKPVLVEEYMHINDYNITLLYTASGKKILNVQSIYYIQPMLGGVQSKVDFDWDYDTGNGLFRTEIQGHYFFEFLVPTELENLTMLDIEYLDLLLALYLMYIGSSRKAFELSEQPFANDGADIYQAGADLWESTLESLKNDQQSWYKAIN